MRQPDPLSVVLEQGDLLLRWSAAPNFRSLYSLDYPSCATYYTQLAEPDIESCTLQFVSEFATDCAKKKKESNVYWKVLLCYKQTNTQWTENRDRVYNN